MKVNDGHEITLGRSWPKRYICFNLRLKFSSSHYIWVNGVTVGTGAMKIAQMAHTKLVLYSVIHKRMVLVKRQS